MKKIFLFLLNVLFSQFIFAQKINWEKDTIYVDKKPLAVMKSFGGSLTTLDSYSIYDFAGVEQIVVKPFEVDNEFCCYQLFFMQSQSQADVNLATLKTGKSIAKMLHENNLFTAGVFNAAGEKRFLLLHNQKLSAECRANAKTSSRDNPATSERRELVKRDKDSDISTTASKTIKQDFKEIGYYTETSKGMSVILTIFLPNGTPVAKLTLEDTFAKKGVLYLYRTDENRNINCKGDFASDKIEEIAKILVAENEL